MCNVHKASVPVITVKYQVPRLHLVIIDKQVVVITEFSLTCRRVGAFIHDAYPRTAPRIVGKGAAVIIIPAVTVSLTVWITHF